MPRGCRPGERRGGRVAGVPNRSTSEIKEIAQQYGPAAVAALAQLAGLTKGRPGAESETARIMAVKELLDRAYGRPTQALVGEAGSTPLLIDFRWADSPAPSPEREAAEVNGFNVVFADEAG